MVGIIIRKAVPEDIEQITHIYNQGIEDRIATLESDTKSIEDRLKWFASHDEKHPVIVAVEDSLVEGFGSLNVFNIRPCYQHVADFSIYVARNQRGKGIGSMLMDELIHLAELHKYHKMVLSALAHNTNGIHLYEKFGFRTVGVYKEMGLLDGKWIDTIIMEKILVPGDQ